jgi:hypothetical protein
MARVTTAAIVTSLFVAIAQTASAHGDVTGPRDFVQDYGVTLALAAIVLIGAGILAWTSLSPAKRPTASSDADSTAQS